MILTTNGQPITFKELNEQAERTSGGIQWAEERYAHAEGKESQVSETYTADSQFEATWEGEQS